MKIEIELKDGRVFSSEGDLAWIAERWRAAVESPEVRRVDIK